MSGNILPAEPCLFGNKNAFPKNGKVFAPGRNRAFKLCQNFLRTAFFAFVAGCLVGTSSAFLSVSCGGDRLPSDVYTFRRFLPLSVSCGGNGLGCPATGKSCFRFSFQHFFRLFSKSFLQSWRQYNRYILCC